jgi:hypothetical protein
LRPFWPATVAGFRTACRASCRPWEVGGYCTGPHHGQWRASALLATKAKGKHSSCHPPVWKDMPTRLIMGFSIPRVQAGSILCGEFITGS